VEQCFSLTAKQPQLAYKPQKQPNEQGEYFLPMTTIDFFLKMKQI
jgi:hypothetical protein